jgi:conjugal transfer ATP-binding protein TraC
LELDDLKRQKQLQQVVLLQLVSQVSHEMYLSKGRKKILIIDEAWELLDDPIMAKAMETAYRKARKYDGSVITVTQGIADLYKSRNSQSMIENASWKIFLQQNAEAIDDVAANGQLRLEEYHLQMLKSVHTVRGNYSELMVVGPGGIGIFRLVVDRFTQILFSTTDKERHDLLSAIDEGKDVIEEIKIMMMGESHYSNLGRAGQIIMECAIAGISEREIRIMMDEAITQAQKFRIKN